MIVSSRAPSRISFAGGGTDVEPYISDYGGLALNAAISKYNFTTLVASSRYTVRSAEFLTGIEIDRDHIRYDKQLDLLKASVKVLLDQPAEISVFSEIPYRSGLGSSASAFVSVLSAIARFCHKKLSRDEIAELAWSIERHELGNMGGRQDQYAAAYGGFNFIEFEGSDVVVNNLKIDNDMLLELEKRVILAYVAPRERSGMVIEEQSRNVAEKNAATIDALHRSKELAREMKKSLLRKDVDRMGRLLHLAWQEKKRFASSISNAQIDQLEDESLRHGALGGKISGAGGGGYMFFIAAENRELELLNYLKGCGLAPEFVRFDHQGCVVWTMS
jgi:D-glycero-alpha-D-manno-heptose-7-phosphate kinase